MHKFPRARISTLIGIFLALAAMYICSRHYFSMRAFWLDEAFIASNLKIRGFHLFGELEHGQIFPRMYLMLIALVMKVFGYDFWPLRLIPFIFGLAGIGIWSVIFFKEYSNVAARFGYLIAMAMLLAAPDVYYFAGELKQYSGDLFFAGYAYWFGRFYLLPRLERGENRSAWVFGWVWPALFSMTYMFVLLSVEAVILFHLARQQKLQKQWTAVLGAATLAAFSLSYFIDLRHSQYAGLLDFWKDSFIKTSSPAIFVKSLSERIWLVTSSWWIFSELKAKAFLCSAGLGVLATAVSFFRRKTAEQCLSMVSIVLISGLIVLSMLKRYPLAPGRVAYFWLPFYVALVAGGPISMARLDFKFIRIGGLTAMVLLGIYLGGILIPRSWKNYFNYTHWEDVNVAFKFIDSSISKTVVYAISLDCPMQMHPHLPSDVNFISLSTFFKPGVTPTEVQAKLGESFYLISMNTWEGTAYQLDVALGTVHPYTSQRVDSSQVYFYSLKS